ncbi:MAG: hypothetical protein RR420_00945 [Anaerovoracaceae bacterium]
MKKRFLIDKDMWKVVRVNEKDMVCDIEDLEGVSRMYRVDIEEVYPLIMDYERTLIERADLANGIMHLGKIIYLQGDKYLIYQYNDKSEKFGLISLRSLVHIDVPCFKVYREARIEQESLIGTKVYYEGYEYEVSMCTVNTRSNNITFLASRKDKSGRGTSVAIIAAQEIISWKIAGDKEQIKNNGGNEDENNSNKRIRPIRKCTKCSCKKKK